MCNFVQWWCCCCCCYKCLEFWDIEMFGCNGSSWERWCQEHTGTYNHQQFANHAHVGWWFITCSYLRASSSAHGWFGWLQSLTFPLICFDEYRPQTWYAFWGCVWLVLGIGSSDDGDFLFVNILVIGDDRHGTRKHKRRKDVQQQNTLNRSTPTHPFYGPVSWCIKMQFLYDGSSIFVSCLRMFKQQTHRVAPHLHILFIDLCLAF